MKRGRRDFIKLMSAASAGAVLSCSSDPGSSSVDGAVATTDAPPSQADAVVGIDGGVSCSATTNDALGPFHAPGAPVRMQIADKSEPGERLMVTGVVVTGADCTTPLAGVLLDIWQSDKDGNYHDAGTEYRLRGQVVTGADGRFQLETIRPGSYLIAENSWRPAHIHFLVTKPGYNPVTTQLYFAGDPFLPPNDGCTTCGSDDPDRIIPLAGSAKAGWSGEFKIILASS